MHMKKITKRDVGIFFLGMLGMLMIEVLYDWDGTVGEFTKGFKAGLNGEVETTK